MPKRIANGLTLLSAVVCVGSALLVVRSFFLADSLYVPIGPARCCVAVTIDGAVMLLHELSFGGFSHSTGSAAEVRSETSDAIWNGLTGIKRLGIGWGYLIGTQILVLPLWLLPLLTAIPPVRWHRARRREGGRGFAVEGAAADR